MRCASFWRLAISAARSLPDPTAPAARVRLSGVPRGRLARVRARRQRGRRRCPCSPNSPRSSSSGRSRASPSFTPSPSTFLNQIVRSSPGLGIRQSTPAASDTSRRYWTRRETDAPGNRRKPSARLCGRRAGCRPRSRRASASRSSSDCFREIRERRILWPGALTSSTRSYPSNSQTPSLTSSHRWSREESVT